VSPKTKSSSRKGGRGLARCRGGGFGMEHRPGSTRSSDAWMTLQRTPYQPHRA
jgi:hypothetical protein